MIGKQLKELVAQIPDNANVALGSNELSESSFYEPDIITGATVQTTVVFPNKVETTIIFDIKTN